MEPFWKRWMKDPKKREKIFKYYWIAMIVVHLMLVFGFLMFIYLLWKQHS
ncbi:MAG: hypothetical protein ACQEP1_04215 [Nanobdellota archaeon]